MQIPDEQPTTGGREPLAPHRLDGRRRVHREVVSFVRRSARMNESQARAWENHHEQWVVPVAQGETETSIAPEATVDWAAAFGRTAPLVVEIGSGTGESLVAMAQQNPQWNIVAFEVFQPAVASTLGRMAREGVDNIRIVMGNGDQGLQYLFGPESLQELWLFFADPWHKVRHHKRRLVSPDFAQVVRSRLVVGGHWRLATDWEDYAQWMREVLDVAPGLVNEHLDPADPQGTGWAPRLEMRPVTKYERKGLAAGRTIHDLTYRKTS